MAGLLLAGEVFLSLHNRLTNRASGWIGPFNSQQFMLQVQEPEEKVRVSNSSETWRYPLDVVFIPKPQKISMSIDDDMGMLALGIADAVIPQPENRDITGPISLSYWGLLAGKATYFVNTEVSNVQLIFKDGTPVGSISYDPISRLVTLLNETTNILNTGVITAEYKPPLELPGDGFVFQTQIIFSGVNKVNNKYCRLFINKAMLAVSGDVDFLSNEFLITNLKGTLINLISSTPSMYELLLEQ